MPVASVSSTWSSPDVEERAKSWPAASLDQGSPTRAWPRPPGLATRAGARACTADDESLCAKWPRRHVPLSVPKAPSNDSVEPKSSGIIIRRSGLFESLLRLRICGREQRRARCCFPQEQQRRCGLCGPTCLCSARHRRRLPCQPPPRADLCFSMSRVGRSRGAMACRCRCRCRCLGDSPDAGSYRSYQSNSSNSWPTQSTGTR